MRTIRLDANNDYFLGKLYIGFNKFLKYLALM